MQRNFPWWSIVGVVLVLAGILGYNIWAYNCGYCAIQDMRTVGPQVRGVAFLVLGAVVCWFLLFIRRVKKKTSYSCTCGRQMAPDWSYCPDCGGHPDPGAAPDLS